MTRTIKNNKIRKCRTTKRRIGGGSATETAVIAYIQNIAVQILNSIEEPQQNDYSVSNTKFYKMGQDKRDLFKFLCADMRISFEKLKLSGGDLINERNQTIHPKKLVDAARISDTLIKTHGLKDVLNFEYSIIDSFLNPKRIITRSMTKVIDTDGFEYKKSKGKHLISRELMNTKSTKS
jgi:hypothetical protein